MSHGKSYSKVYQTWQNMHQRCENIKCPEYKRYGGLGIKICDRWHSFELFYEDVGDPPKGKTLDRFPDKFGNYEPNNWRWATPLEQAQNRRNNRLLTHNGITMSLNYWVRTLRLDRAVILKRLEQKLPVEEVLRKGRASRLTEEQKAEIDRLLLAGESYSFLIKKFGVTKTTIGRRASQLKGVPSAYWKRWVKGTVDHQLHAANLAGKSLLQKLLKGETKI